MQVAPRVGPELKKFDVVYFTASCDTPELNKDFAESLQLDYPILSDPTKEVLRPTAWSTKAGQCRSGGRSTSAVTANCWLWIAAAPPPHMAPRWRPSSRHWA